MVSRKTIATTKDGPTWPDTVAGWFVRGCCGAEAVTPHRLVVPARAAGAWQRHDHGFGGIAERDGHDTLFAELALRGTAGASTWVAGVAYERDDYDPRDVPRVAYTHDAPGVFGQHDVQLAPRIP